MAAFDRVLQVMVMCGRGDCDHMLNMLEEAGVLPPLPPPVRCGRLRRKSVPCSHDPFPGAASGNGERRCGSDGRRGCDGSSDGRCGCDGGHLVYVVVEQGSVVAIVGPASESRVRGQLIPHGKTLIFAIAARTPR